MAGVRREHTKTAMYRIIGADQKEYGPVSAEQLRRWVADGRANGDSLVQAEGSTDWKPLSTFPELAAALSASPLPPLAPTLDTSLAATQVSGPATGLIVTAILGFLANVLGLFYNLFAAGSMTHQSGMNPEMEQFMRMFSGTVGIISGLVAMAIAGLIFYGAMKMKNLQSHGWAYTASILAAVPCVSPCCLIGLPIGIWALVVLSKPEVKSAFH